MKRVTVLGLAVLGAVLVAAGLAGCVSVPSPFDGERTATDEVPASTRVFLVDADADSSRFQGTAGGYDLYLLRDTASAGICLLYTGGTEESSGFSCGSAGVLDVITVTGTEFAVRGGGFVDEPSAGDVEVSPWLRQKARADR
jgi:hypothetical protein